MKQLFNECESFCLELDGIPRHCDATSAAFLLLILACKFMVSSREQDRVIDFFF